MLDAIAKAFHNQDYPTAQRLISQGQQDNPDNPWLIFYEARLAEVGENRDRAEVLYRELLQQGINPKLISQVRQGLQRIETLALNSPALESLVSPPPAIAEGAIAPVLRQAGLKPIPTPSVHQDLAVLILEPVAPEQKHAIAQKFAQIMAISVYEATLKLPTRAWRLYRTGSFNDLTEEVNRLNTGNIPCFCLPISALKPINVYAALYLEAIFPKFTVICQGEQGQKLRLSFPATDLRRKVEADLPLQDKIVTYGLRSQLERKIDIMDYAKVCDFHLPQSQTILRFCDQTYQFNQGLTEERSKEALVGQGTAKHQWQDLQKMFSDQLPLISTRSNLSEFAIFSESVLEYPEMLAEIDPKIDLLRREDTTWDAAFHLYSCLIGCRQI